MILIFECACISRCVKMLPFLLATLKAQNGAWVSVHLHREALGYSLRRANSSDCDGKTSPDFQEESPRPSLTLSAQREFRALPNSIQKMARRKQSS